MNYTPKGTNCEYLERFVFLCSDENNFIYSSPSKVSNAVATSQVDIINLQACYLIAFKIM